MKVIITLQMNCTVTSFQKTGGATHPLGPMDATPMTVQYCTVDVQLSIIVYSLFLRVVMNKSSYLIRIDS